MAALHGHYHTQDIILLILVSMKIKLSPNRVIYVVTFDFLLVTASSSWCACLSNYTGQKLQVKFTHKLKKSGENSEKNWESVPQFSQNENIGEHFFVFFSTFSHDFCQCRYKFLNVPISMLKYKTKYNRKTGLVWLCVGLCVCMSVCIWVCPW